MEKERKKAKESRVVPHPKLNPGCATDKTKVFLRNNGIRPPALALSRHSSWASEASKLCQFNNCAILTCQVQALQFSHLL